MSNIEYTGRSGYVFTLGPSGLLRWANDGGHDLVDPLGRGFIAAVADDGHAAIVGFSTAGSPGADYRVHTINDAGETAVDDLPTVDGCSLNGVSPSFTYAHGWCGFNGAIPIFAVWNTATWERRLIEIPDDGVSFGYENLRVSDDGTLDIVRQAAGAGGGLELVRVPNAGDPQIGHRWVGMFRSWPYGRATDVVVLVAGTCTRNNAGAGSCGPGQSDAADPFSAPLDNPAAVTHLNLPTFTEPGYAAPHQPAAGVLLGDGRTATVCWVTRSHGAHDRCWSGDAATGVGEWYVDPVAGPYTEPSRLRPSSNGFEVSTDGTAGIVFGDRFAGVIPTPRPLTPSARACFVVAGDPGDVAVVNLTPVLAGGSGNGQLVSSDVTGALVASNVNFAVGSVDPNVAFAPVGEDGRVCYVNSAHATVHLVADHLGTISTNGYTPATESGAPHRALDTRLG